MYNSFKISRMIGIKASVKYLACSVLKRVVSFIEESVNICSLFDSTWVFISIEV